jgi:hypothetical protein
LYGQQHADRVRRHEKILSERIKNAKRALRRAKNEMEQFVMNKLEKIPMSYEDARSKFIRKLYIFIIVLFALPAVGTRLPCAN